MKGLEPEVEATMNMEQTKDVNESELPLTGGSGPTAKEARRSSEREGRQSIYQKKQAAAKEAAEKRHPVGSSVSFDPAYAHALGAGVDKHPGLKRFSKPGKTMTGTVVRHSTDITNYEGDGIMNVGGPDNPSYYPVVKLDTPVKVAGRTITHTTINHPYLKIKKITMEQTKDPYAESDTAGLEKPIYGGGNESNKRMKRDKTSPVNRLGKSHKQGYKGPDMNFNTNPNLPMNPENEGPMGRLIRKLGSERDI
jgi:hypothetical protein